MPFQETCDGSSCPKSPSTRADKAQRTWQISDIPYPHYIQVIHDELLILAEQTNREHNLNKLCTIHKRVNYLLDKKKKILKAMKKHYDKTTFNKIFYNFYYTQ